MPFVAAVRQRRAVHHLGGALPGGGAALLGWAWVGYLRLDGIRVPFVDKDKELSAQRGARKRHATHSMADFADEKIVSFDELSPGKRPCAACWPA